MTASRPGVVRYTASRMVLEKLNSFEQCQRIQSVAHGDGADRACTITVERYDERLGWYTAGAVTIPMHQLPLLQQTLSQMNAVAEPVCEEGSIIPFPTLMQS